MPKPNNQNLDPIELDLIKEVEKLELDQRLDYSKDFQPVESLQFLNSLDFKDIEDILNSLED